MKLRVAEVLSTRGYISKQDGWKKRVGIGSYFNCGLHYHSETHTPFLKKKFSSTEIKGMLRFEAVKERAGRGSLLLIEQSSSKLVLTQA